MHPTLDSGHLRPLAGLVAAAVVAMLAAPCAAQTTTLPPLDRDAARPGPLSTRLIVTPRRFRFEGNTAVSEQQLAQLLNTYLDRPVTSGELEDARRALTMYYVNLGYINSGAVLPDQDVEQGVITFNIIEGRLSDIHLHGNDRLGRDYLVPRIQRGVGQPLNINALRDQLEIMRQSSLLSRINAELKPGAEPGDSYLDVSVVEARALHAAVEFSNDRSPSVGAEQLNVYVSHLNLTGHGDALNLRYGVIKNGFNDTALAGLDEVSFNYALPVTAADTALLVSYERSNSLVVEDPFDNLDITSESQSFGLGLRQPVLRTPDSEFALSLRADRRRNETFLLGRPFSFSPGVEDGRSDIFALRFIQEYTTRDQSRAFSARSTLSFGLGALGATQNPGDLPDSRFFAWLGQFQYVQRLFQTNNQVIGRVSTQWASEALLPMEQFSIGGMDTVRGYRRNRLVRDQGVVASVEGRIPLWLDVNGRDIVTLAPFFDFGYVENARADADARNIASAGVGVLIHPFKQLDVRVYWGYPFRDFHDADADLQDRGFHFSIVLRAF